MKLMLSALFASILSAVSAQDDNTSAPFTLKLVSDDSDVNGQFLGACHAGAAIEQLCLSGSDGTPVHYKTFNLNVSSNGLDPSLGTLVWTLIGRDFQVSSGLKFAKVLYSNIAVPNFQPGPSYETVGFDAENKLFINSAPYDERSFVPAQRPAPATEVPLYQWYACWTPSLAYYYHALVWSTFGEPINPTCRAVNVTRVFIGNATQSSVMRRRGSRAQVRA